MSKDANVRFREERRKERRDREARERIRTRPASDAYRDNWDGIFGKKRTAGR